MTTYAIAFQQLQQALSKPIDPRIVHKRKLSTDMGIYNRCLRYLSACS